MNMVDCQYFVIVVLTHGTNEATIGGKDDLAIPFVNLLMVINTALTSRSVCSRPIGATSSAQSFLDTLTPNFSPALISSCKTPFTQCHPLGCLLVLGKGMLSAHRTNTFGDKLQSPHALIFKELCRAFFPAARIFLILSHTGLPSSSRTRVSAVRIYILPVRQEAIFANEGDS
jgi:hypothetical protein